MFEDSEAWVLMSEKCKAGISFVFLLSKWINTWFCCCVTVTDVQCMVQILWSKMWFNKRKDHLREEMFFLGKWTVAWCLEHVSMIQYVVPDTKLWVLSASIWRVLKMADPKRSPRWQFSTKFSHFETLICDDFKIMFVKTYLLLPNDQEVHNPFSLLFRVSY